jgi:hypothetical protein
MQMKQRRYSVHADTDIIICEGREEMKVAVINAQLRFGNGQQFIVEHSPAPYRTADAYDYSVLYRWHVFAHDGYHLIEVVEVK